MSRTVRVREGFRYKAPLIGIPTYNGVQRCRNLLQTMFAVSSTKELQSTLVLLDDGSPRPGHLDEMNLLCKQYNATLLHHPQNEGITKSWNDLTNFQPDAEFVVLLNDDVLLQRGWLENLIYFLENNECGAASPNLLFCDPGDVPAIMRGDHVIPRHPITREQQPELLNQAPDESPGVVMCALGSGFGFRRSVFDAIGGFDENMRQIYNESQFGTSAARDLRLPSFCIPAPRIWHLWSQSFKENPHLAKSGDADRRAYIARFGGDFQGPNGTHPRFMSGMPPRVVKWIGVDGQKHEKEMTIQ